jgi:hypothetical protein
LRNFQKTQTFPRILEFTIGQKFLSKTISNLTTGRQNRIYLSIIIGIMGILQIVRKRSLNVPISITLTDNWSEYYPTTNPPSRNFPVKHPYPPPGYALRPVSLASIAKAMPEPVQRADPPGVSFRVFYRVKLLSVYLAGKHSRTWPHRSRWRLKIGSQNGGRLEEWNSQGSSEERGCETVP